MQACVNILSDGLIQTLLDCESYLVCNGCRVQQYYSRNRDSSWSRMFFRVPILPCRQAGTSKCSQSEFISAGRDCDVTPPPTSSNEHSHPLGSLMQTKKKTISTHWLQTAVLSNAKGPLTPKMESREKAPFALLSSLAQTGKNAFSTSIGERIRTYSGTRSDFPNSEGKKRIY